MIKKIEPSFKEKQYFSPVFKTFVRHKICSGTGSVMRSICIYLKAFKKHSKKCNEATQATQF